LERVVLSIKVKIERFTDDWQPGFVECCFVDALGNLHVFEEKVPIVSLEDLTAQSVYPRDGVIACSLIASRAGADGREVVTVDTEQPWVIESKAGQSRFDVFRNQLVEFDWGAG
jgi:hypothetical protein